MIFVRRIKSELGDIGFHVSHSADNPMVLAITSGTWLGEQIEGFEVEFPVEDVEQNVRIYLTTNRDEPIVVVRGRNTTDPPEIENVALILCNFFIPPGCTNLRELPIYTRRFDNEYSTPFNERGEVEWERLE